jgi:hypothetical protein
MSQGKVTSLVTDTRLWLPVKPRTAAIIGEIYQKQDRIEEAGKGSIELRVDFRDGSMTLAIREVGEPRRLDLP